MTADQPSFLDLIDTRPDPDDAYADALETYSGYSATYSPEDNKLRLYATSRLPQDVYERVKAAGFRWAPKQELFVCPRWTPQAEDLLLELAGEIDDEDYSATERAADRAERFTGYRDKREGEAEDSADAYDSGPRAFGHQSRARAERQARRHDRHRTYATSQWGKAEYWQERTAGVIANAMHRADPATRRGRIKELEADQRRHEKGREEHAAKYHGWSKVADLDGADTPIVMDGYYLNKEQSTRAGRLAYALASDGACWFKLVHPRTGKEGSAYDLMRDHADPITPREAATLWLAKALDPNNESSRSARWSRHYAMRLEYERAMLANEGGTAADADMEPGGWIGQHQIHKVNRSNVTGKVVSVSLLMPHRWEKNPDGTPKVCLRPYNVERLPEGVYRAPTDEERAQFASNKAAKKAKDRETKPKAPPLINPTDEDAQKLQDQWNERKRAAFLGADRLAEFKPSEVWKMTQAEYSARSKGSFGVCETAEITERGIIRRTTYMGDVDRSVVFKVRVGGSGSLNGVTRVVVITDKPQKPIPWDEVAAAAAKQPTRDQLLLRLDDIAAAMRADWCNPTEEHKALLDDARYVGLVSIQSASQRSWTEVGRAAYAKHLEAKREGGAA